MTRQPFHRCWVDGVVFNPKLSLFTFTPYWTISSLNEFDGICYSAINSIEIKLSGSCWAPQCGRGWLGSFIGLDRTPGEQRSILLGTKSGQQRVPSPSFLNETILKVKCRGGKFVFKFPLTNVKWCEVRWGRILQAATVKVLLNNFYFHWYKMERIANRNWFLKIFQQSFIL